MLLLSNVYSSGIVYSGILVALPAVLPLVTYFESVLVTLSLNVAFACDKTDKFILISV